MEILIRIDQKIPENLELQNFIDYLMGTFQLTNHGKISIDVVKTSNINIKAGCGNLCGYEYQDGSRLTRITMKLPKVYTLQNALFTLAHEYCHSLQQDRSEKMYSMCGLSRKERAAGGNADELEADVFGVKVASEYMNIQPHTILEELWETGLYRISKPACAEEFGYVHVKCA